MNHKYNMRKIGVYILLLFDLALAYGSQVGPMTKDHTTTLDTMLMEVCYDVDWHYNKSDSLSVKHDQMILQIGPALAHSYLVREYETVDYLSNYYEKNGKRTTMAPSPFYSNMGEVYLGYPAKQTTVIYNMDIAGLYQYVEKTANMDWELTRETKLVKGFSCKGAQCNFRGRTFKVWYAEDIPFAYGPWKLHGLPGLIMEASTTDGDYNFSIRSIQDPVSSLHICYKVRECTSTSKKKVLNTEALMLKDVAAYVEGYGAKMVAWAFDAEGNQTEVRAKVPSFVNSIEITR